MKPLRRILVNGNDTALLTDSEHKLLITNDYKNYLIHAGKSFFIKTFVFDEGDLGNITEFMFRTPNTATRIHAKAVILSDYDITIEIWEGVLASNNGTNVPGNNCDRDSILTPELLAYSGPTITNDGYLMWAARTGGGKQPIGVSPAFNYEIVAKTNTNYLFRLTKNVGNDTSIDIDFFWSEI